jgi:putative membrane protein
VPTPEDWQFLHPLSPLLRGGVAFVAVVGYLISQQTDRIFGAQAEDPTGGHLPLALGGGGLVLALIVFGAWLSWRFSRFRVGRTMLELRTGIVFRQHRQVHFDRIQAVDISRPVLARLTGLSEVIVQSAGGRDSVVKLSFLTDVRAREVREELLLLAGRSDERAHTLPAGSGDGPVAVTVPGPRPLAALPGDAGAPTAVRPVVHIPNLRLVQASLYSGPAVFLLLAVPALVLAITLRIPGIVAWLGPLTLGVGGRHVQALIRNANFTLEHQGDRLLIRHGLTDLRSTSVPLHRIQAAELSQSLFWRVPGWWTLRVNVAGVGGRDHDTETLLLPVGTRTEALAVLALVRPGIPDPLLHAAMEGEGQSDGFTSASPRASVLDPISWQRRGYAVTPDCVLVRDGVLNRATQVVPHARVQSLAIRQGPVQRARGVASVSLVSTPGPVKAVVSHLEAREAERLVAEQVLRSSAARASADGGPHRGTQRI